jgi:outer membrane protein assembly factor BamB
VAVGSGAVWVALLAVDGQTVWVATADGQLRSVDIDTGEVAVRATTELVTRIRVGQGGLWLMTFDGKVLRLERRTGRIVAQVPGAFRAADLAVGSKGSGSTTSTRARSCGSIRAPTAWHAPSR